MSDNQTIEAYATHIETYREMVAGLPESPHLTAFMANLPTEASVLDFGCGVGNFAAAMRNNGFQVTCMDASPAMIKAAHDLYGLAVEQRHFHELVETDCFHGIWASFSLLHAPKADMPGHLHRMYAALHKDGVAYLGLKLGDGEARDRFGRFYAYYSEEELIGLVRAAGFAILDHTLATEAGMAGKPQPVIHLLASR